MVRENNYDAIGHLRANPGIPEKKGGVVHFNNFRHHRWLDGKRQRREILEVGRGGRGMPIPPWKILSILSSKLPFPHPRHLKGVFESMI